MPPHPLGNFEIQNQYQNEPRSNGVYSRDNLRERSSAEIKDGAYIINLDENSDIGTHWFPLYVPNNEPGMLTISRFSRCLIHTNIINITSDSIDGLTICLTHGLKAGSEIRKINKKTG